MPIPIIVMEPSAQPTTNANISLGFHNNNVAPMISKTMHGSTTTGMIQLTLNTAVGVRSTIICDTTAPKTDPATA